MCGGNKVGSDSPHLHLCECAIDYMFFQPRLGESSRDRASQIVSGFAMQREEARHHCLILAWLCGHPYQCYTGRARSDFRDPKCHMWETKRLAGGEEAWCSDQMRSCELAMAQSPG